MGEEERERGREGREICYYTYFCIHWLILTCALTGDQTCNLGELGGRFNQMSCTARALHTVRISVILYISVPTNHISQTQTYGASGYPTGHTDVSSLLTYGDGSTQTFINSKNLFSIVCPHGVHTYSKSGRSVLWSDMAVHHGSVMAKMKNSPFKTTSANYLLFNLATLIMETSSGWWSWLFHWRVDKSPTCYSPAFYLL